MITEGTNHLWFYHSHHLLYGELVTKLKNILFFLNIELSSLDTMRVISSFSSAGVILLLYFFFVKKLNFDKLTALISVITYSFFYGFIRYSGEAEIVILASFLGISSVYLSTFRKNSKFLILILVSSLSVLIHITNVIIIFLCIPVYYLLNREVKRSIIFSFSCLAIVLSFYLYYFLNDILFYENTGVKISYNFENFVKGIIGFSQAIISFDFLLGFNWVREFLSEIFSNRMLDEEFYFGNKVSLSFVYVSSISIIALFISTCIALFYTVNFWLSKNRILVQRINKLYIIPLLYLISYSAIITVIEPGNPELWIMSLSFLIIILCPLLIAPLIQLQKKVILFIIMFLISFHNGYALLQFCKIETDYNYAKMVSITDVTNSEDIVITACNPVFYRYFYHNSKRDILYLNHLSLEEMMDPRLLHSDSDIYILGDVFEQHKSQIVRFPKNSLNIKKFANKIYKKVELIQNNDFKGIYKYKSLEMR